MSIEDKIRSKIGELESIADRLGLQLEKPIIFTVTYNPPLLGPGFAPEAEIHVACHGGCVMVVPVGQQRSVSWPTYWGPKDHRRVDPSMKVVSRLSAETSNMFGNPWADDKRPWKRG